MEKQVLQTEVLNERQKSNRTVMLFMCLALVAWLFVAIAQGFAFFGGFLFRK